MTYSIIDSVKGGSGKTCFSLHLCLRKHLGDTVKDEGIKKALDKVLSAIENVVNAKASVDTAKQNYSVAMIEYEKNLSENDEEKIKESADKLSKCIAQIQAAEKIFHEAQKEFPVQPLYVDMDIMGSSIESILWGSKFVGYENISGDPKIGKWSYTPNHNGMDILPYIHIGKKYAKRASRYLNDIVEEQYLTEDLITSLEFRIGASQPSTTVPQKTENRDNEMTADNNNPLMGLTGKAWIDMIISNPSFTVKSKFRGNSDNASEINVGEFRYQLYKLLKKINSSTELNYTDIVFDMPPGGDRYSECLYDILLKNEEYSIDSGNLDIYHMTTLDNSHIDATVERVANFYNSRVHVFENRINSIYIVINNTIGAETNIINERRNSLIKKLEDSIIQEAIKEKVKIIDFDFASDYRSVVCGLVKDLNPYFHTNNPSYNFSISQINDMLDDKKTYEYNSEAKTWKIKKII